MRPKLNKTILCALVCSLMAVGCRKEGSVSSPPVGTEPGTLSYRVADMMEPDTYSLAPSEQETRIKSVFFIIIDKQSGLCKGYTHLENLHITGASGTIPFSFPEDVELLPGQEMQVKMIANYKEYLPSGLSSRSIGEKFFGRKLADINRMLSDMDEKPGSIAYPMTGDVPVLMTGEFDYRMGQLYNTVILVRKNALIRLNINLPEYIVSVTNITVSNIPSNVCLFTSNTVLKSPLQDLSLNLTPDSPRNQRFSFYILPTGMAGVPLKIHLAGKKSKEYVKVSPVVSSFAVLSVEQELTDWTLDLDLDFDSELDLPVLENQHVVINVFESLSEHGKVEATMNGWNIGDKFDGQLLMDSEGNGISVSDLKVDLPWADYCPVMSSRSPSFLDGSVSKELFLASIGFSPSWKIANPDMPSWLQVVKHGERNSLIITAEPNFTLTSGGVPSGNERRFDLQLTFNFADGTLKTLTIPIIQAPMAPLGDIDMGTYVFQGKNIDAESYNLATIGPDSRLFGDQAAVGLRIIKGWQGAGNYPLSDDKHSEKCVSGGWTRVLGVEEFALDIYPRMRLRRMLVDGQGVDVYYVAGAENFSFLPILGTSANVSDKLDLQAYYSFWTGTGNDRLLYAPDAVLPTAGGAMRTSYGAVFSGVFKPVGATSITWGKYYCSSRCARDK